MLFNNLLLNLEISTNPEIVKIALKIRPNYMRIVPENRKEITTEGGLNLKDNYKKIKEIISKFKNLILELVYLSIPIINDVKISKKLKVIV